MKALKCMIQSSHFFRWPMHTDNWSSPLGSGTIGLEILVAIKVMTCQLRFTKSMTERRGKNYT